MSTAQQGEQIGDDLVIERELGRGGMGVVFVARDRRTGQRVAVKRMTSSAGYERFEREATILARLDHPGIVRYVAHGEDTEGPWLAMEWLDGSSLDILLGQQKLGVGRAIELGAQLASAIAAAHASGIVHRDLKPANLVVLAASVPRVKVLDFGVARDLDATAVLTSTGATIGTPMYMAPEQLRGLPAGFASDVFALASVVFEMVAGRAPFAAESALAVIGRIMLDVPPRLDSLVPDAPLALSELLVRALSKEPSDRPTAAVVAASLANIRDVWTGAPTVAGPDGATLHAVDLTSERRNAAVLVVRGAQAPERVRAAVARTATVHDLLPNGTVLALFADPRSPDAPILRAVRSGLGVCEEDPTACVVAAAGRVTSTSSAVAGEALERAALVGVAAPGLYVDAETSRMLRDRFAFAPEGAHVRVLGASSSGWSPRLLGKETPTVGRDAELAQLDALVDAVTEGGAPRVALVIAPPGQGKSRVRHELMRRQAARSSPPAMLLARFEPASEGTAWGGLARGLRELGGFGPGESRSDQRTALIALTKGGGFSDAQISFLAEVAGVAGPEDESVLGLSRRSPEDMREGIADAVDALLRHRAGEDAALLILEDAHWADGATLALVESIAARPDLPAAIVAFTRPDLFDRFPDLWKRRSPLRLDLPPMPPRAAARLARSALPPETDEAAVNRIVELGAGNALVLEELVRAYVDTGRLTPTPSARSVFEARIARLLPVERLVARTAAVIGEVFWDGAVASLLGPTGVDVAGGLAALEREELVISKPTTRFQGTREYGFRHALLRDAAEGTLTEDTKRELHAGTARWLMDAGEIDHAAVARHAEPGGLPLLAGEMLGRAGHAAAAAADPATGAAMLEHALRLLPREHPERFRIHLTLERLYRETSVPLRRLRHLAAIRRRRAPEADPAATAMSLAREATYRNVRHGSQAAATLGRKAVELAKIAESPEALAEASYAAGTALCELGEATAALGVVEAALSGPLVLAPIGRTMLLQCRAIVLRRNGNTGRAIETYQALLSTFDNSGAPAHALTALDPFGYALIIDSQLARARAILERSRATRQRAGYTRGAAMTEANLGNLYLVAGDWSAARKQVDHALRLHAQHGDVELLADTTVLKGRAALAEGDRELVARLLVEADRLNDSSESAYDRANASLLRARWHAANGHPGEALTAFRKAASLADRGIERSMVSVGLAEAARIEATLGEPAAARQTARIALDALDEIDASEWAAETLAAILDALDQLEDDRRPVIDRALAWLASTRTKIGDDGLRSTFNARPEILAIEAAAKQVGAP